MTLTTGVHDRRKKKQPISPLRKSVCANLRKYRTMAGWSQKTAAQKLKMSQPSYCAIETGRDDIRLGTLEKMAEVYKTDVRAFLAPVAEEDIEPAEDSRKKIKKPKKRV